MTTLILDGITIKTEGVIDGDLNTKTFVITPRPATVSLALVYGEKILMALGKKICAIKAYRDRTLEGLKESKLTCERWLDTDEGVEIARQYTRERDAMHTSYNVPSRPLAQIGAPTTLPPFNRGDRVDNETEF